jgi:hypothetical protein
MGESAAGRRVGAREPGGRKTNEGARARHDGVARFRILGTPRIGAPNIERSKMASEDCAATYALALMRRALRLMDDSGSGLTAAACHLSMAIDAAEGQPILKTEEEACLWFARAAALQY